MAAPSAVAPRGLHQAIAAHRIYFEVERETVPRGDARITVAVRVALWATIGKGAGSLPDAPGCRAAVTALEAAAAAAIARARLDPAPDVEPFRWALYASRHLPDADEVRLTVNVRAPPGADGPEPPERERALARMRRALEDVGVAEGTWRSSAGVQGGADPPAPAASAQTPAEAPAGDLVPAHA